MMRYKIILVLFVAVSLFSACSKISVHSDNPFDMEVSRIQATACWVDIVPENNEFFYYFNIMPADEFASYKSKSEFIDAQHDRIWAEYAAKYVGTFKNFKDVYLVNGAYFEPYFQIQPETEYVAYAFSYNDVDLPEYYLTTAEFKTEKYVEGHIYLDSVALSGSRITVIPSNDDETYFWDYEMKSIVERDFHNSPEECLYSYLRLYWEYGFLESNISRGKELRDMASNYGDLKEGDAFYLMSVGYNNGVNTPMELYELTYMGENKPGIVKKITHISL